MAQVVGTRELYIPMLLCANNITLPHEDRISRPLN